MTILGAILIVVGAFLAYLNNPKRMIAKTLLKGQTPQDFQNEMLSADANTAAKLAVGRGGAGCLRVAGFTAGILLIVLGVFVFVFKMI